jgi:hypothetical protein
MEKKMKMKKKEKENFHFLRLRNAISCILGAVLTKNQ